MMNDYSEMSDFEINREVAKSLGASPYLSDSGDFEKSISFGDDAVIISSKFKFGSFDPCNDPGDAWPIIVENKINIDHRESIKAGPMASQSGRKEIYAVDKKPLRAAMIVFLMMKGAENGN